mgnify:CR=1 FL=1
MEIYKKFSFDSAHYLPNLPEDHKCKRMHGHTFNVEIHITGNVNQEIGWIMDFAEILGNFKLLIIPPVFDKEISTLFVFTKF